MNLSAYNYKTYITVRFADLNAFGIVNNNVYLTYFEIAHTGYWKQLTSWSSKTKGIMIGRAEVKYMKPIYLNDEVYAYVRTARVGNCSFDVEYILTLKKPRRRSYLYYGKKPPAFFTTMRRTSLP